MSEFKTPVYTFRVDKICDKCNRGRLHRIDGDTRLVLPPQYPHECNFCNKVSYLAKIYPYIAHEE